MATLPVTVDELVFPDASHNFSQVLSSLKRSKHSIRHRLASIYEDSNFVKSVAEQLDLPLVANERCGSWYIPLEVKGGSVYFKSTDGHHGQWSFNTRRLNLHLIDIVEKHNGCIIIDSTRRGKSMPDALSKTIPTWCAVMNRFLLPDRPESHDLPGQSNFSGPVMQSPISASERTQINSLLPTFLASLQSLNLDVSFLRSKLSKPLCPVFVTPSTPSSQVLRASPEYHTIVCCTASRQESGDLDDGFIQGAGDDTEMWAHGLTAEAFWRNRDELMADTSEEELQGRIAEVMEREEGRGSGRFQRVVIGNEGEGFWVGMTKALRSDEFDGIVVCDGVGQDGSGSTEAASANGAQKPKKPVAWQLNCPSGKLGSRTLREKLPLLKSFMERVCNVSMPPKLLFACETGKDLSIGIALAVLCLYYDDNGNFTQDARTSKIDKSMIRQRLVTILNQLPGVNPPRATLQSVNSFLMKRPR